MSDNNMEKIIKLLKNEHISNYAFSKLSGEKLIPDSILRYRNGLDPTGNYPKSRVAHVANMHRKTKMILLEIAEEVEQAQPKSKEDVQQLIQDLDQSGKLW